MQQQTAKKRKLLQLRFSNPVEEDGSTEMSSMGPSERARSRWRNAINLVITKIKRAKLGGVKVGEWDTTSDSDDGDLPSERIPTVSDSLKAERNQWLLNLHLVGS